METEIIPDFVPFDTLAGRARYFACYEDAWRVAHGSLRGFQPDSCWRAALLRASEDPEALSELRVDGRFAGVLALDCRRGAFRGVGWIAFCYVVPELRGRGLGRALILRAGEVFRERGRRRVRLTVAPGNPALGFYERLGFVRVGSEAGALEDLYVMEQKL